MTTRDPRSRVPERPDTGREGARDPTQSLSLEIDPDEMVSEPAHPSLAVGTSDVSRDERTKIESPGGRHKPPESPRPPPTPSRNPDDPDLRIGTVLGAYRLVELLGKGGMGYVFRAEHIKLGREVALKLLRGDYAKRRDAVLRFFQEAKTVNRVRHRNIVDVTDFVELDDGTTFIIMEFLRGQSLGKWARTGIDLPRALAVLVQICDGLAAAHAVGVVHRDLKPDNVIVVPTVDGAELVKLLDFGVAKLLNRDDEDIGFQTAAGSVIGTPAYMSPEQAGGMAIDHRSDIYSLGAIMYELFCGQPMFRGRSFGEYVRKHLTELPVPPRQTANGAAIDERLEALILRCLAKEPGERFGTIIELRDGLLALLGGIETHPPGYAALAQSGIVPAGPQLPSTVLPLPAPGMVTTMPTPPAGSTQMSGVYHPSLHYSHYSVPPEPMPEPATPWWVWLLGGAFAVGLGITGALWYANRTSQPAPQPVVSRAPTAAPIEPAPPKPALIALRFDSLPSAGVYADGRSAELCRTPCHFNVDLADGGPTDRRSFVVRADGYHDRVVVVDFSAAQREFSLTLERERAAAPPPPDPSGEEGDRLETRPGKKIAGKKPDKADKKGDKKPEVPVVTTPPVPEPKPDVKKPDDSKKPTGPIDPAETIDPFRRKQ
jgi:serine/threonine protein kinase